MVWLLVGLAAWVLVLVVVLSVCRVAARAERRRGQPFHAPSGAPRPGQARGPTVAARR
jgi:hypothetical protein